MPSRIFATAAWRSDQEPPRIPELRRLARRGLSASTNDTSTARRTPSRSATPNVTGNPLQRPIGAVPFTKLSRSTGSRSPLSLSRKPDPLASWNQIIVPFTLDSLLSTVGSRAYADARDSKWHVRYEAGAGVTSYASTPLLPSRSSNTTFAPSVSDL